MRRLNRLVMGAIALVVGVLLTQTIAVSSGYLRAIAPLAQAQGNAPPPELAPALPMVSGSFSDPQGRFQIGILEGFTVSSAAGSPLFQSTDGSLAYTVAVAPLPTADTPNAALMQAAQSTFGNGEGFVAGDVQPIPGGGVRINWAGRLSQGATPPQPITGKIFARQRGTEVFLLLVAATQAAEAQLSDAITALGSTLTVP
ncbi:hypothetical protein [Nodosilinea sp. E11]|uniref:hypothetical protein n=1 Tax=Nodosilinea sp. E11 TaxID=3037479 RepID=UPI002934D9D5|nr:hypothetical protein [Nodosilinea sp. E11]WOD39013.1 hypothetical protein RRF56_22670 [Nodosilinea sp. E11]